MFCSIGDNDDVWFCNLSIVWVWVGFLWVDLEVNLIRDVGGNGGDLGWRVYCVYYLSKVNL